MVTKSSTPIAVFWFRRDLRLEDNTGLAHALKSGLPVLPLFIFDQNILAKLEDKNDARVEFIHRALESLHQELHQHGCGLRVEHGDPLKIWKDILQRHEVKAVFTNHDYEPYATQRDTEVTRLLAAQGVEFKTFKDQVIFEKMDVEKGTGGPYTVFTPYSRKWKELLKDSHLKSSESEKHLSGLLKVNEKSKSEFSLGVPSLSEIGFSPSGLEFPKAKVDQALIKAYAKNRNTPSIRGTTRLGIHLRFGTVSIRQLVKEAKRLDETWLNELIWREFFMQILWNFPHVVGQPFRPEYAGIQWRHDEKEFKKWCEGKTGYPIVDAGMRELNETGFMHNRVRMIVGSFLVKDLLIDWRWGEAYFARKLLDFELSSNNGNWQWVAGTGCDAAPYFRIFNPDAQTKKFDPDHRYIKTWVKEFGTMSYPEPMVDHSFARERTLTAYKNGLGR
jgi:deoxyribodipyrimidine photo-lyase